MHFVVIGNGVAGISAAMVLRGREPKVAITVIGGESDYFVSRTALMYSFMDRLTRRELEPFERDVYRKQAIERVRDQVTDLDDETRQLRLKSGRTIGYDRLLLATGSVPRVPAWPGLSEAKQGVVNFVSLQDLDACERWAGASREAVVAGGGLIGIELVECLRHHGLRVTFLVREPYYWPAALGAEEAAMVTEHIARHGVDVRLDEVSEVITDGEARVRAVRTQNREEFPCQMLGVAVGVKPAIEWLKTVRTPPVLARGIRVDTAFRTSLATVWAAGDCAEIDRAGGGTPFIEQIWYSAKRQGELAARSLLGDAIAYQPPIFYNSSKFFDIEYTTVGVVNDAPKDAVSFFARHPGREASVRVVHRAGAVVGFNMLGSRWNHTLFERWIAERRSLAYAMEHLAEAQFDVEFGRQELGPVMAAYRQSAVAEGVGRRRDGQQEGA